jgi:hypothetical protein
MSVPNIDIDIHSFKCDAECEKIFNFFDQVVSGALMVVSIIISCYFANKHLTFYSNPFYQDKIIGISYALFFQFFLVILFMAPFYAITSYFGIVFPV